MSTKMRPKVILLIRVILMVMALFSIFLSVFFTASCSRLNPQGEGPGALIIDTLSREAFPSIELVPSEADRIAFIEDYWRWIFGEAGLPEELARRVAVLTLDNPSFLMELLTLLAQDPYTYRLVDKQNHLPLTYEPDDLVPLRAQYFRLNRGDLELRAGAAQALEEMAQAAAAQGISFVIGSAYRSGERQAEVYQNWVRTLGRAEADRVSAQPGASQHQLGTVVDFFPIDDTFALTPASDWLKAHASRFGWSLSYPEGYEEVTGYRWESWHYRYVGPDLSAFIDTYFDGVQQYALQFIQAWMTQAGE
ncbi:MAG: M15 family metallopeptidase [Treponema sp.]|nr:M15 family metallopeptidase [Treponema sp.]